MKKRIIRGCLRIAILAVAGGVLGWLSSILFGERAAEPRGAEDRKQTEELARNAGKGAGYGNQGNYNRQFPG